jgi:hypothetical protein
MSKATSSHRAAADRAEQVGLAVSAGQAQRAGNLPMERA